ncbi:hypothetical protein AS593_10000 [Caulobacter vibrioides]|nr:hypothetical protein AS593_10000 [Caulobacter vibrioides]
MAYEEVQGPAPPPGHAGTSSTSLFNTASSAKELVRRAEYGVAAALPRRLVDEVLAEALGVSTEVLRTAFARVHGESIYRALLKLRVELVDLTLASDPALSPRAVAQVCGFGYFGRFHQIYRRNTGRSPEAGSTRDVADGAALQRARAAVAVAVGRLFEGVEPLVVAPAEPRSVDGASACRP